jgi:hypothetical protein
MTLADAAGEIALVLRRDEHRRVPRRIRATMMPSSFLRRNAVARNVRARTGRRQPFDTIGIRERFDARARRCVPERHRRICGEREVIGVE